MNRSTQAKTMNPPRFDESTLVGNRFAAIKDHLFSELKGEGVILSLTTGKYYGLNEVGRSIWSAIQQPSTFQEIQTAILAEYDVSEEVCRQEVASFLAKMAEENLIDIFDGNAV